MNEIKKARKIIERVAEVYGYSINEVLYKKDRLHRIARYEAIKQIRKKTNLTLSDIASLFKVSPQAIAMILKKYK